MISYQKLQIGEPEPLIHSSDFRHCNRLWSYINSKERRSDSQFYSCLFMADWLSSSGLVARHHNMIEVSSRAKLLASWPGSDKGSQRGRDPTLSFKGTSAYDLETSHQASHLNSSSTSQVHCPTHQAFTAQTLGDMND